MQSKNLILQLKYVHMGFHYSSLVLFQFSALKIIIEDIQNLIIVVFPITLPIIIITTN